MTALVGRELRCRDLVVVVPGLLGSTLRRGDERLWGGLRDQIAGVLSLGRRVEALGLEDPDEDDGVVADGLLASWALIPRLFGVDGYGDLVRFARIAAPGQAQVVEFPYDWRRTCRHSAQELSKVVAREHDRWRVRSDDSAARVTLVCHSMGGLVARWYVELLGGWERVRRVVTIGTPYRGSAEALGLLATLRKEGLIWRFIDLSPAASFPSIYELLPQWECIEAQGGLRRVDAGDLGGQSSTLLEAANEFHERVNAAAPRGAGAYSAIIGDRQPTHQSATGGATSTLVRALGEADWSGDGTVPLFSAFPPEWADEAGAVAVAQRHAVLQSDHRTGHQLEHLLRAGQRAQPLGGEIELGVDLPDVVPAGEAIRVAARAFDAGPAAPATLAPPLEVAFESLGQERPPIVQEMGYEDERYAAEVLLPADAYRVTVRRQRTASVNVDAVTDYLVVAPDTGN